MPNFKVTFNEKRALKIFSILDNLWINKAEVFKDIVLPQDIFPMPKGEREMANYLFFCALAMRGGVISEDPFRWFYEILQSYPELYDPKTVATEWNPDKIAGAISEMTKIILNGNGTGEKEAGVMGYKLDQHSKNWFNNAKVLHERWGGDLRNAYWGAPDFEEVFRRIDNRSNIYGFGGMRRKIFSLLTIWLQEKNLIPIFPTPLPIDFHCLRILWATKSIDIKTNTPPATQKHYPRYTKHPSIRVSEAFVDTVAMWSQKFLAEVGISHMHINPAVWIWSRDLCALHLQNNSRKNGEFLFDERAIGNVSHKQRLYYEEPCKKCALEKYCTGAVPSAPYYHDGVLMWLKRVEIVRRLPGFDSDHPANGRKGRTKTRKK